VFDVSQIEGEPLPDLDTEAAGETGNLVLSLRDGADELDVDVQIVPADEWEHGAAKGVCTKRSPRSLQPLVEMQHRENQVDLAVTLLHEFPHALLLFDVDDGSERTKREVGAEAVAYIVGRYCGLETSGSAFYLAAWNSDDTEVIQERVERISRTAEEIIGVLTG